MQAIVEGALPSDVSVAQVKRDAARARAARARGDSTFVETTAQAAEYAYGSGSNTERAAADAPDPASTSASLAASSRRRGPRSRIGGAAAVAFTKAYNQARITVTARLAASQPAAAAAVPGEPSLVEQDGSAFVSDDGGRPLLGTQGVRTHRSFAQAFFDPVTAEGREAFDSDSSYRAYTESEIAKEAVSLLEALPEWGQVPEQERTAVRTALVKNQVEGGGFIFDRSELGALGSLTEVPLLELTSAAETGADADAEADAEGLGVDLDADAAEYRPYYANFESEVAEEAESAAAGGAGGALIEAGAQELAQFWDWRSPRAGSSWRNVTAARAMQCSWRVGDSVSDDEQFKFGRISQAEERDLAAGVAQAKAEVKPSSNPSLPYGWIVLNRFQMCSNEKSKHFVSVLAGALYQGDGLVVSCG
jgi:hypothetical protein